MRATPVIPSKSATPAKTSGRVFPAPFGLLDEVLSCFSFATSGVSASRGGCVLVAVSPGEYVGEATVHTNPGHFLLQQAVGDSETEYKQGKAERAAGSGRQRFFQMIVRDYHGVGQFHGHRRRAKHQPVSTALRTLAFFPPVRSGEAEQQCASVVLTLY